MASKDDWSKSLYKETKWRVHHKPGEGATQDQWDQIFGKKPTNIPNDRDTTPSKDK